MRGGRLTFPGCAELVGGLAFMLFADDALGAVEVSDGREVLVDGTGGCGDVEASGAAMVVSGGS